MQGTIVMLMALSGMGCHHMSCAPAYGGGCYGGAGGYYAGYNTYSTPLYASCYSGCYSSYYGAGGGCYGGCYSSYYGAGYASCYGGCYGGRKHCGLFSGYGPGLFGGGGLFGCHRNRGCYGGCYGGYSEPIPAYDCYTGCSPAVFGSYTPVGPASATGQTWGSSQAYYGSIPGGMPIPGSQGVVSTVRTTAIPGATNVTTPAPDAAPAAPVPAPTAPITTSPPVPAAPAPAATAPVIPAAPAPVIPTAPAPVVPGGAPAAPRA